MAGEVKPLNVSPFIKGVRYSLFILGIFYGSFRYSALKMYESRAKVLRHKMLHEKHLAHKQRDKEDAVREITLIAKDFEVTEFPPGWDNGL